MGEPLRTLIVDDEPIARELLQRLVERLGADVVGTCENGLVALEAIRQSRPDLVLLDVQMPGLNGFQVVEGLSPEERPPIVFVTAHDEFALRAFDVHAIDYLLKPVDEGRLATALERARSAREPAGWKRMQARLERFLAAREPAADELQRETWLVARRGDQRVPLRWDEVVWLESAGNYVRVHTLGAEYLLRSSLADLAERLRDRPFLRVRRGTLVNLSRIVSMHPIGHGDFSIRVAGGAELTMSRRYRASVEDVLGPLT